MSKTALTVNGRTSLFEHHDLLVVSCLAISAIRARSDGLGDLQQQWSHAVELQAPGVLELRLEEQAQDAPTRERLVALLMEVESTLVASGTTVALRHLKEVCRVPGMRFERAYPTEYLLVAVRHLLELIQEPKSIPTEVEPAS